MKQKPDKPGSGRPHAGDEGAPLTQRIMAAVTRLRNAKQPRWSADRLAAEMSAAGVPWTRNAVVNLESGRRKHIAVHELLALAWVLGVDSPVELLVPADDPREQSMFPVTPSMMIGAEAVRAWLRGETGPLREALAEDGTDELDEELAGVLASMPEAARRDVLMLVRSHSLPRRKRQPEADDGGL